MNEQQASNIPKAPPPRGAILDHVISTAEPKGTASDNVRREIDAVTRQLHGLIDRLKRVKDSL